MTHARERPSAAGWKTTTAAFAASRSCSQCSVGRLSAAFLRGADPELHRQLGELEKSEPAAAEAAVPDLASLGPDDFDVPLQATASRSLDTCLRGARLWPCVFGDSAERLVCSYN